MEPGTGLSTIPLPVKLPSGCGCASSNTGCCSVVRAGADEPGSCASAVEQPSTPVRTGKINLVSIAVFFGYDCLDAFAAARFCVPHSAIFSVELRNARIIN